MESSGPPHPYPAAPGAASPPASSESLEAPLLIVEGGSFAVRTASAAAAALLGQPAESLIGRSLLESLASRESIASFEDLLHRAEAPGGASGVVAFRYGQQSVEWPLEVTSCGDTSRPQWCLLIQPPADDDYGAAMEWIGDGFLILDRRLRIRAANPAAEQLLERTAAELDGRGLEVLFRGIDRRHLEDLVHDAWNTMRPQRLILPLAWQDCPRNFELSFYPAARGMGILLREVTQSIQHEQQIARLNATMAASQELLRRKNDELNSSLEKLEEANRSLAEMDKLKSEFLATASHELRTPLNSIIGFLQLIRDGLCETRDEEIGYINNALTSASSLLAMINDVLDIAKIEAGKMTLLVSDLDIEEIFHDVATLVQVQAQCKGLSVKLAIEDEGLMVRADPHKIRQILINLAGNAVKFTSRGGVELCAGVDPASPGMVQFRVRDTGIGIPAPYLNRIFEKFVQVDPSSTRRFQGTGLGLTISRNLVELMGGSIRAESGGDGMGTTMSFTLPIGGAGRSGIPAAGNGGVPRHGDLPQSF